MTYFYPNTLKKQFFPNSMKPTISQLILTDKNVVPQVAVQENIRADSR